MKRALLRSLIVIVGLIALSGCATPATYQGMTVLPSDTGTANPKLKAAIAVGNVSGGEETNPLWMSKVDNTSFRKALEESLAVAGYLAPPGSDPHYTLNASLRSLDQPWFGITLDVTSKIDYTVTGDGTTRDYPVTATGTGTFSDSAIAIERLRIANEKSIKENITELLGDLQSF